MVKPRCKKDIYKCDCIDCRETLRKIRHRKETIENFKKVPVGTMNGAVSHYFIIANDGSLRRI